VAHLHHDNGSEFYKHFISACEAHRITQFWNYPKQPRYNGMVERFNRTIQEEYIDYRLDELVLDMDDFNRHLMDWLGYYNTGRPHHGLKLQSPMQHILGVLQLPTKESNMLWTNTGPLPATQ
jgi:putative transposase